MRNCALLSTRALLAAALVSFLSPLQLHAGSLEAAKALYAEASYEEALEELASSNGTDNPNEIDQYRALCLLALGRTNDVQRSLEAIVARSPLYALSESDVSPLLVQMFRDVRKRALPDAARSRYTEGKAAYDAKEYERAAAHFRDVLAIASELDAKGGPLGDVKQLAEGFLTLTNAAIAAAAPPPPPVEPPAAAVAAKRAPPAIYSSADTDVRAPVEIERNMPPWRPPSGQLVMAKLRGTIEILIDERGNVESAKMTRPVWVTYDDQLLQAARGWRFSPALKDGAPVKYRKALDIILNPPSWHE